jgi:hypothetical protein
MAHVASEKDKPTKSLVAKIDVDTHKALTQWALDEDRSLAGQTRLVLRDAIPKKYWGPVKKK